MRRAQLQFPDDLYDELKRVASLREWTFAETVRRAAEILVLRHPAEQSPEWTFPVLSLGEIKVDADQFRDAIDAELDADH